MREDPNRFQVYLLNHSDKCAILLQIISITYNYISLFLNTLNYICYNKSNPGNIDDYLVKFEKGISDLTFYNRYTIG